MVSSLNLRDWPAVAWLLLCLSMPLPSQADSQPPGREPTRGTSRKLAKPLPESEGDAVRAQIGKRCTITLINGSTREGVVTDVRPGVRIWLATPSGKDEPLSWQHIAAVTLAESVAPSEPKPAPAPSPDPLLEHKGGRRIVYLKNGERRQGTVLDLVPGQWLTLRTTAGAQETLPWGDIESLQVLPDWVGLAPQETPPAARVVLQSSPTPSPTPSPQPAPQPAPQPVAPALDAEFNAWTKSVQRTARARPGGDAQRAAWARPDPDALRTEPASRWSFRGLLEGGGTYRWSRVDSMGTARVSLLLGLENPSLLLAWAIGGEVGRTGTGLVAYALSVGMTVQGVVHSRVRFGGTLLAGPQFFRRATSGVPLVGWDLQIGPSLMVDLVQFRSGLALFGHFWPALEVTGLTGSGFVMALSAGVRLRSGDPKR